MTETNLDGNFIQKEPHPRVIKTKIADSIIRNYIADKYIATLLRVRFIQRSNSNIVVATIGGVISPTDKLIEKMEAILREKMEDPSLQLVVQFLKLDLYDREGHLKFELTGFVDLTSEQEEIVAQAKAILQNRFQLDSDFSLAGIDYTLINNIYYFFLEINGSQVFPIKEVEDLERLVSQKIGHPAQFYVMSNLETVVTSKGYESYRIFSHRIFEKLKPKLKKDMKEIIKNSNL